MYLTTNQAVIKDITFYGDFLSQQPLDELKDALRGCPFRQADVRAVLERFPLHEFFGSITADEVLELMFHATKQA